MFTIWNCELLFVMDCSDAQVNIEMVFSLQFFVSCNQNARIIAEHSHLFGLHDTWNCPLKLKCNESIELVRIAFRHNGAHLLLSEME